MHILLYKKLCPQIHVCGVTAMYVTPLRKGELYMDYFLFVNVTAGAG